MTVLGIAGGAGYGLSQSQAKTKNALFYGASFGLIVSLIGIYLFCQGLSDLSRLDLEFKNQMSNVLNWYLIVSLIGIHLFCQGLSDLSRLDLEFKNQMSNILNWYRSFLNEDFNVPITKKHKQMCVFKKNPSRRPDYYIRPENAEKWVKWLKEHRSNPVYWRLAVLMLSTGVRVGEACGLKWEEIDLEKGIVRIIRQVSWDHFTRRPELEEATKTAQSARLIMIPEKLKNILRKMKEETQSDLVFTDSKGELIKYNAIQSAFNAGFTDPLLFAVILKLQRL